MYIFFDTVFFINLSYIVAVTFKNKMQMDELYVIACNSKTLEMS